MYKKSSLIYCFFYANWNLYSCQLFITSIYGNSIWTQVDDAIDLNRWISLYFQKWWESPSEIHYVTDCTTLCPNSRSHLIFNCFNIIHFLILFMTITKKTDIYILYLQLQMQTSTITNINVNFDYFLHMIHESCWRWHKNCRFVFLQKNLFAFE